MKGFITITPVSPSKAQCQRSVSVNTKYIVSIGKVDENTSVVTTTNSCITARESYEEVQKLIAASQEREIPKHINH